MTESAEYYITYFGGTILKEYNGVYLVKYKSLNGEIRYAVVTYHFYDCGFIRNTIDGVPGILSV